MWILALGLAVLELARAVRAGRKPFDQLELDVMYLFGRIWHAVTWNRPAPVPERGPAIVIANHGSLADPCFLIAGCPRKIHFLQAKECYEVPLLRHLFRLGGCIPVARNGKDVAAVRLALERLAHGAVLGVFPEGNLDRDDLTQLGEAHLGVAFLALHSRAPVVPAYISGGRVTPDLLEAWLRPTRRVHVTYGDPVDLSAYHGRRINRALLKEVTSLLMARVVKLRVPPGKHRVPKAA